MANPAYYNGSDGYFVNTVNDNDFIEPIKSMNWIHAMWANIQFDCSSKGLPSFKDAPTWTSASDNTSEFSARTIVGKSEGMEVIELVVETDPIKVYRGLLAFYGRGIMADLLLTYVTRSAIYQPAFGTPSNDDSEPSRVAYYPETFGAQDADAYDTNISEVTIVVPKCTLTGLTPAGGENNSISNTTIKLQPEGGPVINLPYLIQTNFYDPASNEWAYQKDSWTNYWKDNAGLKVMEWNKAWDGATILDEPTS